MLFIGSLNYYTAWWWLIYKKTKHVSEVSNKHTNFAGLLLFCSQNVYLGWRDLSPTSRLSFISNYSKHNPCWFKFLHPPQKLRNKGVVIALDETISAWCPVSIVPKRIHRSCNLSVLFCGIASFWIELWTHTTYAHSVAFWNAAARKWWNAWLERNQWVTQWGFSDRLLALSMLLSCTSFCWISLGCAIRLLGESNLFWLYLSHWDLALRCINCD